MLFGKFFRRRRWHRSQRRRSHTPPFQPSVAQLLPESFEEPLAFHAPFHSYGVSDTASEPPRPPSEDGLHQVCTFVAPESHRDAKCPVCLEELAHLSVTTGHCLHLVHTACLTAWFQHQAVASCPVCRLQLASGPSAAAAASGSSAAAAAVAAAVSSDDAEPFDLPSGYRRGDAIPYVYDGVAVSRPSHRLSASQDGLSSMFDELDYVVYARDASPSSNIHLQLQSAHRHTQQRHTGGSGRAHGASQVLRRMRAGNRYRRYDGAGESTRDSLWIRDALTPRGGDASAFVRRHQSAFSQRAMGAGVGEHFGGCDFEAAASSAVQQQPLSTRSFENASSSLAVRHWLDSIWLDASDSG